MRGRKAAAHRIKRDKKRLKVRQTSGEPKSLRFLYRNPVGRGCLKLLVRPRLSRIAGRFMDSRFSRPMIKRFVRKNQIDLSICERNRFSSFNDFFTRRLRPEVRPVDRDPKALISPCDSKLSAYEITEDSLFLIKDALYSVEDLLENKELADRYQGGYCLVFRLAVDDYHRYCYIDSGEKTDNVFIPGVLHTVQPIANSHKFFKKNSREYTILMTDNFGDVVQMEVGALLVGRICNHHGEGPINRGDEKGKFEYGGSTIVLLIEKGRVELRPELLENTAEGLETAVKLGERIGRAAK